MRRPMAAFLTLMALMSTMAAEHAAACGDKFLVVGRGIRYQRVSREPASILIYKNLNSSLIPEPKVVELQSSLLQAGHSFRIVTGIQELDEALGAAKYDLILVDVGDAPNLQDHFAASVGGPRILPVVYNPESADAKEAGRRYKNVVKNPGKQGQVLYAVAKAVAAKEAP